MLQTQDPKFNPQYYQIKGGEKEKEEEVEKKIKKKRPGFSGFCVLTNVKQTKKALIFTNGEEKSFSGDTFAMWNVVQSVSFGNIHFF